jgi:hypothetical protein
MAIEHEDVTSVHRGGYVQSSDPGAVGAYIFWTDTTTTPHILKVRNAGNTDWVQVGYTPAGTNVGASGEGVFKQFAGGVLEFKKIKSTGGTVTVTSDTTTINLEANAGSIAISGTTGQLPSNRISMGNPAAILAKPTIGAGAVVEVTLGTGLEFDGTTLKVSASGSTVNLTGNQSIDGVKTFTSSPVVPTPSSATQAANKTYVDTAISSAISSLSWHDAVRVATTTSGTLASDFENGDTIDGVTLVTGNRILIKNQSTASENGIYVVQVSGAPVRATDADAGSELENAAVFVQEGTANENKIFLCTTTPPITIGASNIVFTEIGLGSGIVDGDKGDIIVSVNGTVWTLDTGINANKLADGSVSNTEFQYIGGLTSDAQAQIDSKLDATDTPVGLQTIWLPAGGMTPRTTAGAQATTREINGITVPVLAFDSASDEGANFSVGMPNSWDAGTITFLPIWTTTGGGSSQTVNWALRGGCFADSAAINTTGFGTAVDVDDTWIADDDVHEAPESTAVTLANAAKETLAFFELIRDVSEDDLAVDAELIGMYIFYTTEAGTDD